MTCPDSIHDCRAEGHSRLLYVAFGADQVAIGSSETAILERLQTTFQAMLTSTPGHVVGDLRIVLRDGCYRLFVNNECTAERISYNDLYPHVTHGVVEQFIHARPDLIWLHAGGVMHDNTAVVFAGPWGHGKSTLVMRLHEQGWAYLSDDVVPFDPRTHLLFPFPLTPRVRQASDEVLSRPQVGSLPKMTIEVRPGGVCRQALLLGGFIFPQYVPRSQTLLIPHTPAAAAAELLRNCLSFVRHRETAVRALCDLVQCVPILRLTFADSQRAAELIEQAAVAFSRSGTGSHSP